MSIYYDYTAEDRRAREVANMVAVVLDSVAMTRRHAPAAIAAEPTDYDIEPIVEDETTVDQDEAGL